MRTYSASRARREAGKRDTGGGASARREMLRVVAWMGAPDWWRHAQKLFVAVACVFSGTCGAFVARQVVSLFESVE